MTTPTRQQSMTSLEIANRTRLAGAQLKREVRAGTLSVAAALWDERAQSLSASDLLCAQMRWGPTRATQLLNGLHIWPNRRVARLTDHQKQEIADQLTPREVGVCAQCLAPLLLNDQRAACPCGAARVPGAFFDACGQGAA